MRFLEGMRPAKAAAVAHCITVTIKPIRVQLPGGAIYAPALLEAAAKTGARSGLAKRKVKALTDMVAASVAVLNSGNATMITLEMRVHDDSIDATVSGKGCSRPTKKLNIALDKLADKKARSFERKKAATALVMSFEV